MHIDVRYKLALLFLVSIVSFSAKDVFYGTITFAITIVLVFCMGQGRRALKYSALYLIVLALLGLTAYLPPVVSGVVLMVTLCVRMFMPVLLYTQSFIATTTVSEMVTALYRLRLPRSFVITFAAAMRFFPTAREELRQVNDALRLRGISFSLRNLVSRPTILFEGYMIPLMMRASTISEELSAASISRGLDNPNPRTAFFRLRISPSDTLVTVLGVAALCAVFAMKMIASV